MAFEKGNMKNTLKRYNGMQEVKSEVAPHMIPISVQRRSLRHMVVCCK